MGDKLSLKEKATHVPKSTRAKKVIRMTFIALALNNAAKMTILASATVNVKTGKI